MNVTHHGVFGNDVALFYIIHVSFMRASLCSYDVKERHKGHSLCNGVHVAPAQEQSYSVSQVGVTSDDCCSCLRLVGFQRRVLRHMQMRWEVRGGSVGADDGVVSLFIRWVVTIS